MERSLNQESNVTEDPLVCAKADLRNPWFLAYRASERHIVPHTFHVDREAREALNGHRGAVLWLTGISGSGKSTIAHALDESLNRKGVRTYVLDGDNVRMGLNKDLGFSPAERTENIRRVGEVSKLFFDSGLIVIVAFISPYRADRDGVRGLLPPGRFIEIFVDCPLSLAEERDPKGLYKKARDGAIQQFTGINDPYEAPSDPELRIQTQLQSPEEAVARIESYLEMNRILSLKIGC